MDFTCYKIQIQPLEAWRDILMAEFSEIGFDSFQETENGFDAYAEEGTVNNKVFSEMLENYKGVKVSYEIEALQNINWNATWESSYKPINIDNKISIRSDFHLKDENAEVELLIHPKMSFGTGHHETTSLVLKHLLEMELQGKKVLDVGCGTGVLAIYCAKKASKNILAVDIDDWAVENAKENVTKNKVSVSVEKGDVTAVDENSKYDLVLANINKNILLKDLNAFVKMMKTGAEIILSGFLVSDKEEMEKAAANAGLVKVCGKQENDWLAIKWKLGK